MKKRILSMLIAIAMVITMVPALNSATTEIGGTFTLPNFIAPIEIIDHDCPEMNWIAISDRAGLEAIADNLDGNFYLAADIDLYGEEWLPIGRRHQDHWNDCIERAFRGTFDGQGHVIRNMTITTVNPWVNFRASGLFGFAAGADIKNVGLEDTDINFTVDMLIGPIGGIVGDIIDSSISNVYNTGSVSAAILAANTVGGVAGMIHETTITDSYNIADVSGENIQRSFGTGVSAGGIAGKASQSGYISSSFNTGNVTAVRRSGEWSFAVAGGIIGEADSASVTGSFNTGNVFAAGQRAFAGGIVGYACSEYGRTYIDDCYNAGNITAFSESWAVAAGGIFHADGHVGTSYNAGNVFVEGAFKAPQTGNFVQNGSNNGSSNVMPFTTAEMRMQSTFADFDFENTWTFIAGVNNGMPVLQAFRHMYTPTLLIENADFSEGWIEIRNSTDSALSARGLFLSNDAENLSKLQMPAIIVRASGSVFAGPQGNSTPVHKRMVTSLGFCAGDTLYLSDGAGRILSTFVVPM